jgi:hypothetical protein
MFTFVVTVSKRWQPWFLYQYKQAETAVVQQGQNLRILYDSAPTYLLLIV